MIGADDFFGRDAFVQLAAFLNSVPSAKPAGSAPAAANETNRIAGFETLNPEPRTLNPPPAAFAMVGYRLANTLSENGAVARGVCTVGSDSRLQTVVENTGILRSDVGPGRKYSGEEIVSMNCWAFTPAFFPALDRQWREFIAARGTELKSEFYLPEAVSPRVASAARAACTRGLSSRNVTPNHSAVVGRTATVAPPPAICCDTASGK